jgi:hypothetical protein
MISSPLNLHFPIEIPPFKKGDLGAMFDCRRVIGSIQWWKDLRKLCKNPVMW